MKKLTALALGLLMAAGTTFAQDTKKPVKAEPAKTTANPPAKAEVKAAPTAQHVKKDGTPDKRYKENKTLKKDGTPDKRYKENKAETKSDAKK